MLDRIIGIAGCVLGITGCVANVIANNKIKRVSTDMENHVNYMHSSEQNSIESKIDKLNNRINEIVKNADKVNSSINCIYDSIDDVNETVAENNKKIEENKNNIDVMRDVMRNEISNNNAKIYKDINKKFNDVAADMINMNNWGKGVNAAIEQLEMVAEKSDKTFKPIIKAMLDERRNVAAETSIPTAETTVAVATETQAETEIKTEEPTTEATPETKVEATTVVDNKPPVASNSNSKKKNK